MLSLYLTSISTTPVGSVHIVLHIPHHFSLRLLQKFIPTQTRQPGGQIIGHGMAGVT